MNLSITFRHMEHTPALDGIIREKSEKFSRWFGPATDVHWTCWKEGQDFCSEVKIHHGHQEFFAKDNDDNLYKTFDNIIQKIHNQMK